MALTKAEISRLNKATEALIRLGVKAQQNFLKRPKARIEYTERGKGDDRDYSLRFRNEKTGQFVSGLEIQSFTGPYYY